MKILFLCHSVAWRGNFLRAFLWGRQLALRGNAVTIIAIAENARWRSQEEQRDGVRIVRSPDLLSGRLRSGWDPWDTAHRVLYTLPERYDVIHSVDSRPVAVLPALVHGALRGTPVVIDWGDWWGRGGTAVERSNSVVERLFLPVETFFEERFRRKADAVVVLTTALYERARALGVAEERLTVMPHGADVDRVRPTDKYAARRRLGLSESAVLLGYVGTMLRRDRALAIESFVRVCELDPNIRLLIIGWCELTPEDFPATVRRRVLATGRISFDALRDYVSSCDAMWLPLRDSVANRGRFPSKLSDYLAAGKPVVASRVGDVVSYIEDGPCGLLTGQTPDEVAHGILNLTRRCDLIQMSAHARRVAEQRLDWRLLTSRLESVYRRVTQEVAV